ncbi:hypothetical protein HA402_009490 [Bradysia odoriphaga]|nr:hypothetical protein HA402_009490 [Bradysia odoriphaga]
MFLISVIFVDILRFHYVNGDNFSFISLPDHHLPYYFKRFPQTATQCLESDECPYRSFLLTHNVHGDVCWGYEYDCLPANAFSHPQCPGDYAGYVQSKENQIDTFYTQADFGYIRQQLREMRIMCEPLFPHDSMLECSNYLRFCRARNIMIDFTDLIKITDPFRYKTDVLKPGQIGGYCKLHRERLHSQLDHLSALQSWAPELRNFQEYNERPVEANKCDRVIDKPTFIMKIDAGGNMYHHFCDFFNLYMSMHGNASHPEAFTTDVNILIWETYTYSSPFAETFKAFTQNPILDLKSFRGETVCFRNLVLPLLPRMIFGLYYNTPIVSGCRGSGLFQAFSDHVLHRLQIPLEQPKSDKILRITFLARRTKYRQILNIDELVGELAKDDSFQVQNISYEGIPFSQQLEITRNTDIFIGMHGAGLTHLLFLPKWASLFELYHCEDPGCYSDLARLRGVHYLTWEDQSKLIQEDDGHHPDGSHAKFTNYSFDRDEFMRLVNVAADYVRNHVDYQKFIGYSDAQRMHEEL